MHGVSMQAGTSTSAYALPGHSCTPQPCKRTARTPVCTNHTPTLQHQHHYPACNAKQHPHSRVVAALLELSQDVEQAELAACALRDTHSGMHGNAGAMINSLREAKHTILEVQSSIQATENSEPEGQRCKLQQPA